ncbi:MAG: serine/threonine-protein kinase [Planctomycetota bacterium]
MTGTPTANDDHDRAIEAAVERYLEALARADRGTAESTLRDEPHAAEVRARLHVLERIGLIGDDTAVRTSPLPIAGYRIERRLGRGGMGVVWLARAPTTHRAIALKCLRAEVVGDHDVVARFRREVLAVASLRHEGIVELLDAGVEDGMPWMAMEFVDGPSLQHLLDALGQAPTEESAIARALAHLGLVPASIEHLPKHRTELAVELVRQAAAAVAFAHAHGHVHRDLKPSNLMLRRDGRVVVLDFGLAIHANAARVTATGAFVGSPLYSAPEMLAGKATAAATLDVFALGITLCELLTGTHPYAAADSAASTAARAPDDTTVFDQLLQRLPRDVAVVCMKAIDSLPERRYPDAAAFAADLQHLLAFEPVAARPPGLGTRVRHAVRRRPLLAGIVATALPFGALACWSSWEHLLQERRMQVQAFERLSVIGTDLLDRGAVASAKSVLEAAVVSARVCDDAVLLAHAEAAFGRALMLHESPEAAPTLQRAMSVLRIIPSEQRAALQAQLWLGMTLVPAGRDGQTILEDLVAATAADDQPATGAICVEALLTLTRYHARSDRCADAQATMAQARATMARLTTPPPSLRLAFDRTAALLASTMGEHEPAVRMLRANRDELTLCHRDPRHPEVLRASKDLFDGLFRAGDYAEAVTLGADLLDILPLTHDALAGERNEVATVQANVLLRLDRPQEALALCRYEWHFVQYQAQQEHRGVDACAAGAALWHVGIAEAACNDADTAITTLQSAIAHCQRMTEDQPKNCFTGRARLALARAQWQAGRRDAALASADTALTELWWATPILPDDYLECLRQVRTWQATGDSDRTLLLAQLARLQPRLADLATEGLPQSPLRLARHRAVVGQLAVDAGESEQALAVLPEALAMLGASIGEHHRFTRTTAAALASARARSR